MVFSTILYIIITKTLTVEEVEKTPTKNRKVFLNLYFKYKVIIKENMFGFHFLFYLLKM